MSALPLETSKPSDGVYAGYEVWKQWTELFVHSPVDAKYFRGECRRSKISGADVLEIGFGAGRFLSWCCSQKARASGVEVNPVLIAAARERDFPILAPDFERNAWDYREKFDTIVAMDVLEHLELPDIRKYLAAIHVMLRPGGTCILRFPNGQSPFGLATQHGDPTHVTPLSLEKLTPFLDGSAWEIVSYRNAYEAEGPSPKGAIRFVRRMLRGCVELVLAAAYSTKHPWGAVVTLVARKRPPGATG